jgi:hypothetical protein
MTTEKMAPLSEKDFLHQVTDLANIRGWHWVHIRSGMTRDSWRTPISGPLGKGFPDLLLCRRERILFLELKREGAKPTPEQIEVLGILGGAAETMLVWPNDWDLIESVLK